MLFCFDVSANQFDRIYISSVLRKVQCSMSVLFNYVINSGSDCDISISGGKPNDNADADVSSTKYMWLFLLALHCVIKV